LEEDMDENTEDLEERDENTKEIISCPFDLVREPGEKWFSDDSTYYGDERMTSDDDMPEVLFRTGYEDKD
jgi:hypothetical protein